MPEERCTDCGRTLTADEVALTKKFINRGATRFYCLTCLSRIFKASEDELRQKIIQFREMGCTLFERKEPE